MADTLPSNPSDNLTGDNEKDLNSLSVRVEKMPDSAEKTELQKKVRELLAEVKAQNTKEQEKKLAEKDRFRVYNDRKMSEFSVRISSVGTSLDAKTDENSMKLKELLKNTESNHSYENVSTLQGFMRKNWTDSVVSKKGDPDGFFGPLTMGSLEKIVEIKKVENNPTPATQKEGKEGGTESKPTTPELKPEDKIKPSHIQKQNILKQSHTQIPSVPAKSLETKKEVLLSKLDEWVAYFSKVVEGKQQHFRNKAELEKDFATIGGARDGILKYINQLTTKKDLTPEELEKINSAKILIARYFADELPSISNNHFKDYALASTQLLDVIGVFEYTNKEKQTSRRMLPQPPTRADIEKKLADTPEGALIKQHLRNGKTMDQILTNPKFKSAWFNVTEKIYGEWEDKLGKQLKWTLDGYNAGNILLNPQQLEALNLLNNIHGVEILDIASRNKDRAKMFGTGLLAIGAGAAGAALTATGVGAVGGGPMLALASSVIIGGVVTTGAGMAIDGRIYSGEEWFLEGVINTATFAVGGMLFKLGAKAAGAGRVAKVGLYIAETGGVVATGVASDKLRGCFYGADVSLTESIKQNLVWALLPLAFRAAGKKGVFTERQTHRAEAIENNLKRAETQTNMGDKAGAKATLQGVVKDAENLADDVKQTAENSKSQGKGKTGEGNDVKTIKEKEGGTKTVEGKKNVTPLPKTLSEAKEQTSKINNFLSDLTIPLWDFLPAKFQARLQQQSPKKVKWFKHVIAGDVFGEIRKGLDIVRNTDGLSSNIFKGTFDIARTALWSQKSGSWKPGVFTWGVTGLTALEMYSNPDPKKSVLGDFTTKQINNAFQLNYIGWLLNILIEVPDIFEASSDTGHGMKPGGYVFNRVTGETPQAPSIIAPFFK